MKHFIKTFSCILVAAFLIGEPTFAALPSEDILDMFNSNNVFYYNPSGSDDLCGYSMTRLSGNTIAEKIWNYFINQGFTDAQVAGILGNAKAESSIALATVIISVSSNGAAVARTISLINSPKPVSRNTSNLPIGLPAHHKIFQQPTSTKFSKLS